MKYKDYLKATEQLLRQSQRELFPYLATVSSRQFVVYEGVFSPKYFKETEIFAKHLSIHPGEHLLEIGSGTGAIAVTKALEGAGRVVATDISHEAVKNIRDNAMRHNVLSLVDVREGDLFSPIGQDEKFDVVFWNTPFGKIQRAPYSVLEKAVFDRSYRHTMYFIFQAANFLKQNGRIVLGFSSTLGQLKWIKNFCLEAELSLSLVHQEKSEEQYEVSFELFEARPNK